MHLGVGHRSWKLYLRLVLGKSTGASVKYNNLTVTGSERVILLLPFFPVFYYE